MAEPRVIRLPHEWAPRPYQRKLWDYLETTTALCKPARAVVVWPRRSGKDSVGVNFTACAAMQRTGVYFHMCPIATQARKVVWDNIDGQGRRTIDQAFPRELQESRHENEMRIKLASGSIWQVVGSDNYDTLVGTNPVGLVFSEFALADPKAWELMRPILAENNGWAIFISTPRGMNHLYDLFEMAKDNADWFTELQTADDTGVPSREAIERDRASGMSEPWIKQEYYCNFASAVVGAYFGSYLETAQEEGRIGNVPWESALPVHTAWDLGIDDSTAIWFFQRTRQEIRLIDYYETCGVGLEHYVKELDRKPYTYGRHYLPHDAQVRELGTGRSRFEVLRSLGLRADVVPKQSVEDGIEAVRSILGKCWFDEKRCALGLKAMKLYRTEYDPINGGRAGPVHDWSSHAADAFRYLALSLERVDRLNRPPRPQIHEGIRGREVFYPGLQRWGPG